MNIYTRFNWNVGDTESQAAVGFFKVIHVSWHSKVRESGSIPVLGARTVNDVYICDDVRVQLLLNSETCTREASKEQEATCFSTKLTGGRHL